MDMSGTAASKRRKCGSPLGQHATYNHLDDFGERENNHADSNDGYTSIEVTASNTQSVNPPASASAPGHSIPRTAASAAAWGGGIDASAPRTWGTSKAACRSPSNSRSSASASRCRSCSVRSGSERSADSNHARNNSDNKVQSNFGRIDKSDRQHCGRGSEVLWATDNNEFQLAREREFVCHETTQPQEKNSASPPWRSLTTLHNFIKDDRDATYRAQCLTVKCLAGLGLSLRTIERVTSPRMQTVIAQAGWISGKRTGKLLESNDLEKKEIEKRIQDRYLCLLLDDEIEETTNNQISVLQVYALSLDAPVTLSVRCHSDHSTVESLRAWVFEEFELLQSRCRVLDQNVVALVTSNGTPVAGAAHALIENKFTSCERVPCVNHGLHLVVENFLNELEDVAILASSLKGWLEGHDSDVKKQYFVAHYVPIQPLCFAPTRWGGTLLAVFTICYHWDSIYGAIQEYRSSERKHERDRGVPGMHHEKVKYLVRGVCCIMETVPRAIRYSQQIEITPQRLFAELQGLRATLLDFSGEESLSNLVSGIADFNSAPGITELGTQLKDASRSALKKFEKYVDPAIEVLRKQQKCFGPLKKNDYGDFRSEFNFSRAVWNTFIYNDRLMPPKRLATKEQAKDHWSAQLERAEAGHDEEMESLAQMMLKYLTMTVSNATVERAFSQGKNRSDDPQASPLSDELTEGFVNAETNSEIIDDMVYDFDKEFRCVPPRRASASHSRCLEGEE
eukprot:gb/GECG01005840.1/.p1 GENE.gb/GECG01005840.1/~~gb/GECG01005840.1/.p1  ORF type:complete len:737 (+),score=75.41 gb/GECG01005840.1/:1-2211(+)